MFNGTGPTGTDCNLISNYDTFSTSRHSIVQGGTTASMESALQSANWLTVAKSDVSNAWLASAVTQPALYNHELSSMWELVANLRSTLDIGSCTNCLSYPTSLNYTKLATALKAAFIDLAKQRQLDGIAQPPCTLTCTMCKTPSPSDCSCGYDTKESCLNNLNKYKSFAISRVTVYWSVSTTYKSVYVPSKGKFTLGSTSRTQEVTSLSSLTRSLSSSSSSTTNFITSTSATPQTTIKFEPTLTAMPTNFPFTSLVTITVPSHTETIANILRASTVSNGVYTYSTPVSTSSSRSYALIRTIFTCHDGYTGPECGCTTSAPPRMSNHCPVQSSPVQFNLHFSLCLASTSIPAGGSLPFLGTGFDIFKMQPTAATIVDTTKMSTEWFEYQGYNYTKPEAFDNIEPLATCTLDSSTSTFSSFSDYAAYTHSDASSKWSLGASTDGKLTKGVAASLKIYGSSNEVAEDMYRATSTIDRSIATLQLQCDQGIARLQLTDVPISSAFNNSLKTLPSEYNSATSHLFLTFFAQFGTHYYQSLTLGTLLIQTSSCN